MLKQFVLARYVFFRDKKKSQARHRNERTDVPSKCLDQSVYIVFDSVQRPSMLSNRVV